MQSSHCLHKETESLLTMSVAANIPTLSIPEASEASVHLQLCIVPTLHTSEPVLLSTQHPATASNLWDSINLHLVSCWPECPHCLGYKAQLHTLSWLGSILRRFTCCLMEGSFPATLQTSQKPSSLRDLEEPLNREAGAFKSCSILVCWGQGTEVASNESPL